MENISENNVPDEPVESPDVTGETPEGGEGNAETPDIPAEGAEEGGVEDAGTGEDGTGEDSGSTPEPDIPAPPSVSGNEVADIPKPENPVAESAQELADALGAVAGKLDGYPDGDGLMESFRTLADAVSRQTELLETYALHSVPLSGYHDYSYPVHVIYRIYPAALGSETKVSNDYATPEEFEDGYNFMTDSVTAGNLAWFSIFTVSDAEGAVVYDEYAAPEEPENPEEPEEPDTFREDVLNALDALNDNINTVSANDLEYREQALEFHEQYLELQQENNQLQYHLMAGSILIAFVLMITLGYTIAHGFLQRMKVG